MNNTIENAYNFVIVFDVKDGNPNGDPDANGMPRMDMETGHGIVTDVCLKRKIRGYVEAAKDDEEGYGIYIKKGSRLNTTDNEAFEKLFGIKNASAEKDLKKKIKKWEDEHEGENADITLRDYMCRRYYDIRTFGAVVTTATKVPFNCGQVKGPIQMGFSRSVDPITIQDITITRMAVSEESNDAVNTMGAKYIIPYGLYRCEGFVSANLANKSTGFSEDDLNLFWEAIMHMFDEDRSSMRGVMAVRELVIFKHKSMLGNVPADKLFDLVKIEKKPDVEYPRKFSDYTFSVGDVPEGVSVEVRDC